MTDYGCRNSCCQFQSNDQNLENVKYLGTYMKNLGDLLFDENLVKFFSSVLELRDQIAT